MSLISYITRYPWSVGEILRKDLRMMVVVMRLVRLHMTGSTGLSMPSMRAMQVMILRISETLRSTLHQATGRNVSLPELLTVRRV
jgi:hypothetical protein